MVKTLFFYTEKVEPMMLAYKPDVVGTNASIYAAKMVVSFCFG